MTKDEWIERYITPRGPDDAKGAKAYLEWIEQLGGITSIAQPSHGSIRADFPDADGELVCAFRMMWHDGAHAAYVELQFETLMKRRGLQDRSARGQHHASFNSVVPLSNANLEGRPNFKVALLADPNVRAALTPVALHFVASAVQI